MPNDLMILKKIKEGNIDTFECVFRRYYTSLYFYSFGIIGESETAEEIVQELFYVLWKDRENLNVMRSLKNYLYGAVRNQSLQYLEQRSVRERYRTNEQDKQNEQAEYSPLEQLEYKELEKIINETLSKLPERRLRIFRMHRFEGRKYKEIAEILSVSVKTVEAEMTKAYQVLRQNIEKYIYLL